MNFLRKLFRKKPYVIVIAGPTATGKSSLAVELAQKYNGEVISADSRQVYEGLDIGSAKIQQDEMGGVPHHMLDVASPKETYTVADFKQQGQEVLKSIQSRKHLPIICGGSGFYIDHLIYDRDLPEVPPNETLRKHLHSLDIETLMERLRSLDPKRALAIDPQNKVRIIRALEVIESLGKVPKRKKAYSSPYRVLYLCLTLEKNVLHQNIQQRVHERMDQGMVDEIRSLKHSGVSWERLESFGLEYRFLAQYLQGKITEEEAVSDIIASSKKFAKRQYTWFKKNPKSIWFNPTRDKQALLKKVKTFLNA